MIIVIVCYEVKAEMAASDIRDIHVPSGAALCWRRNQTETSERSEDTLITETSERAVRERDRMLLGSAHAVPLDAG